MNKLVLFGDSFVSLHLDENCAWTYLLADNLNIPRDNILNFGKVGTGLEWSICEFIKYLNSNDYTETDVIVFVTTSHSRPPIMPGKDQTIASSFSAYYHREKNLSKYVKQYYKKYDSFYRTWFDLQTDDIKYKDRWLLALALKQLPNFTILMSAFQDLFLSSATNNPLLQSSDNFLKIDSDLISISENEIINKKLSLKNFFEYFNGEVRTCHLSNSNNRVLADQLYKCISKKDSIYFDNTKYFTNLYDLTSEYKDVFVREFNLKVYKP